VENGDKEEVRSILGNSGNPREILVVRDSGSIG
jgi:hypothetical protein